MQARPVHSFTTTYSRVVRVLITDAQVGPAFDPVHDPEPSLIAFKAIWDTGATASVITQEVVDAVGLKPTGMTMVHHAHGTAEAEQYLITLKLPSNVGTNSLRVTKGILGPGTHMLIGMDVIANGDFSVTNHNGHTQLSFRLPSCAHVDYVKSIVPKQSPAVAPLGGKVGRNERCPCGSGKKYKHCHGKA